MPGEMNQAARLAVRDVLLSEEGKMLMTSVADQAAQIAVTKTLLSLGIDASTPEGILAAQDDMRHLRWWNHFTNSATFKIITVAVTLTVTAGWASLASAIRQVLGK